MASDTLTCQDTDPVNPFFHFSFFFKPLPSPCSQSMGAMSVKYSWFSAKYLRCMDSKAREAGVDIDPSALSAFSKEKLAHTLDSVANLGSPATSAALAAPPLRLASPALQEGQQRGSAERLRPTALAANSGAAAPGPSRSALAPSGAHWLFFTMLFLPGCLRCVDMHVQTI